MRRRPLLARLGVLGVATCLVAGQPVLGQAGHAAPERRAPCRAGQVSLTFDDGPAAGTTARLLRILRARRVPATFFMNGYKVADAPRVARLVERRGFLVANHGFDHADMTGLPEAAIEASLRRTDAALRKAGAHPVPLMRPPYGAVDADVITAARRTGNAVVLWDVDPYDWDYRSAEQIATSVLEQLDAHQSNVVIMHDGVANSPRSVDAVPRIVATARRRGYCFVALDERGRPGYPTPTAALAVEAGDRRVREGESLRATVTLPYPAGRRTTVRLAITSETGSVADDLEVRSSRVRIPAGATAVRVRVPVRRDGLDEGTERFGLSLAKGTGVRPTSGTVSVAVKDRDRPPKVSGEPVTVAEPSVGTAQVPVVFRLSRPSGREVRLTYRTLPGSADGSDYIGTSGSVTIPAGGVTAVVLVSVYADLVPEGAETFLVHLDRAEHATVRARDAVVTIDPG